MHDKAVDMFIHALCASLVPAAIVNSGVWLLPLVGIPASRGIRQYQVKEPFVD